MRALLVLIAGLAVSLMFVVAQAQSVQSPHFEAYRAQPYNGSSAKVRITDAKSRQYAAALRDGAHRPVNFAGHFILANWGCGASCTMGAAINAKTGDVAWLPFTVCCWPAEMTEPLEFRVDSRLLVVHGSRNERGEGVHYYSFDGRRFDEIETH